MTITEHQLGTFRLLGRYVKVDRDSIFEGQLSIQETIREHPLLVQASDSLWLIFQHYQELQDWRRGPLFVAHSVYGPPSSALCHEEFYLYDGNPTRYYCQVVDLNPEFSLQQLFQAYQTTIQELAGKELAPIWALRLQYDQVLKAELRFFSEKQKLFSQIFDN